MISITLPRIVAFAILLGCVGRAAMAEESAVSGHLADALPSGAFAYAESHDLGSLIGVLRKSQVIENVLKSSLFNEAQSSEPFAKAYAGKSLAEHVLRMNLWDAGKKLLDGKMGLALYPGKDAGEASAVLLIRPTEKEVWATQRDWIDPLLDIAAKLIVSENGVRSYVIPRKDDQMVSLALHENWMISGD
ncbi:hypothetical protein N9260_01095 [bacterium]|nr:hypothetical protein [bacterium]